MCIQIATENARKTTKCELNVQYHDPRWTLDIYYPDDGNL